MAMTTTRLVASCLVLVCLLLHSSPSTSSTTTDENPSHQSTSYIVRVRPPPGFTTTMAQEQLEHWYRSFLPPRMDDMSDPLRSPFIHTYRGAAMFGFAANFTRDEAEYVGMEEGVLKVYRDKLLPLQTTHTPDFLGLRRKEGGGAWKTAGMGEGVIIGVLDSGIDFAHTSFDDSDMSPPPDRWRGSCNQELTDMKCTNKIIGARMFIDGTESASQAPVDHQGHGTHTASTAAGRFVQGASVLGSGNGTAAGMAPRAHLAVYHVCKKGCGCPLVDIVAGMDAAIADGVDVLSMSIAGDSVPFDDDVIAVGAFSAMRKGIFVSCAAGNNGPFPRSVSNVAPWILTVGASTVDRKMVAIVKLGDGRTFVGESAYQPSTLSALPLVYHGQEEGDEKVAGDKEFGKCFRPSDIAGNILVCEDRGPPGDMGKIAKAKGAAGLIMLRHSGTTRRAEAHVLPVSCLNAQDAAELLSYIQSSDNSTASIIFKGTSLGLTPTPAPMLADFSSRGPSRPSPGILKPDIIGPGVNVIAAWPFRVGPEDGSASSTTDFFNTLSGTSMSTPHLSGIAAVIKGAHPKWSPAAIKSAMMTTAYVIDDHNNTILDESLKPAGYFDIGAGHVNPLKVTDPGLIYDIHETHYILYLCGLGYTDDQVEIVTQKRDACNNSSNITEAELNYPSLVARASAGKLVVNRTVTNVGDAVSSYTMVVDMPKEVNVTVSPAKLEFSKLKEKKTFTISLSWDESITGHAEGSFKWVSEKHVVRSPIVIF